MSPAAQAVHGISDTDLAGAAPARVVLPEFLDFLGASEVIALLAHNSSFDARFLGVELGRAGLDRPELPLVDTLALARGHIPDLHNHRLDTLARLFNLGTDDLHRARRLRVEGLWLALGGRSVPAETLVSYPIFDPARPVVVPVGWEAVSAAIVKGCRFRSGVRGERGESPAR